MQPIIIIIVVIFAFGFIKEWVGDHFNEKEIVAPSNKTIELARDSLHIPQNIPIPWASHHMGMAYIGDAAIVNSEYITNQYSSNERKHSWQINIMDINRYTIEQNKKWSFIHFILKDGSEEILTLKNNEVALFEKEFAGAKEFMEYAMQQ